MIDRLILGKDGTERVLPLAAIAKFADGFGGNLIGLATGSMTKRVRFGTAWSINVRRSSLSVAGVLTRWPA